MTSEVSRSLRSNQVVSSGHLLVTSLPHRVDSPLRRRHPWCPAMGPDITWPWRSEVSSMALLIIQTTRTKICTSRRTQGFGLHIARFASYLYHLPAICLQTSPLTSLSPFPFMWNGDITPIYFRWLLWRTELSYCKVEIQSILTLMFNEVLSILYSFNIKLCIVR